METEGYEPQKPGVSVDISNAELDEGKLEPAHLFTSAYTREFLKNKHVVVIGDSIQRGVYKDIVLLLQQDRLLVNDKTELKEKGEKRFLKDRLVLRTEALSNGRDFTEIREYQSDDGYHLVHFYYVTRCFNDQVAAILEDFKTQPPDVVLMNSCLWDISRYGDAGEDEYKDNLGKLFTRLRQILAPEAVFIWCTTLPLASEITPSGFLLDEIQFLAENLRVCVLEANYYVAQIALAFGFDVLDLHFYLRAMLRHREKDGVHWDSFAHRHITDLWLTFLHDTWGYTMPEIAAEKFRQTNQKIDLKHFGYTGYPVFVKKLMKDIGRQVDTIQGIPVEESEESLEEGEGEETARNPESSPESGILPDADTEGSPE